MSYGIEIMTSEGTTDLTNINGFKLIMTHTVTSQSAGSVALPVGSVAANCRFALGSPFPVNVSINTTNSTLNWTFYLNNGAAISIKILVFEI